MLHNLIQSSSLNYFDLFKSSVSDAEQCHCLYHQIPLSTADLISMLFFLKTAYSLPTQPQQAPHYIYSFFAFIYFWVWIPNVNLESILIPKNHITLTSNSWPFIFILTVFVPFCETNYMVFFATEKKKTLYCPLQAFRYLISNDLPIPVSVCE